MLRKCAVCGTQNRVPAKRLADTGRCGNCKAALPPLSTPIDATSETFRDIVRDSAVPVLVDFWAAWCGPCKMAAPEVEALAREMAGHLIVLKIDTEQQQQIAAEFRIRSIPTFMVFREGQVVSQRSGMMPRTEMRRWIEG